MSISILPPASSRPGLARALASIASAAMDGPALKAEAIRLHPLTGMSKRKIWKKYDGGCRGWTTVQRYLDPNYPLSFPPPRFVQYLKHLADGHASLACAREFEAASR